MHCNLSQPIHRSHHPRHFREHGPRKTVSKFRFWGLERATSDRQDRETGPERKTDSVEIQNDFVPAVSSGNSPVHERVFGTCILSAMPLTSRITLELVSLWPMRPTNTRLMHDNMSWRPRASTRSLEMFVPCSKFGRKLPLPLSKVLCQSK